MWRPRDSYIRYQEDRLGENNSTEFGGRLRAQLRKEMALGQSHNPQLGTAILRKERRRTT